MRGRRRAAELRRNPGDFVGVLMVHHGTEILVQQGMTATVNAGTAALWDGVRPVDCATMGHLVKHTMFVPRDVLARAVPDLDSVLVRTLPASVNLRLLRGWLNVARDQRELDAEAARTAERMAVDLLAAAIDQARDGTSGTRSVLRQGVKAYLVEHLGDAELTLDVVARANAISLRYLHMLFEGTGETARDYLRRRRLERAHDILLGHSGEVSVAETARRCGFDNPSSFSRAYRSRYGRSPREARHEGLPVG
jgi:AraC-like DNA-binding protein